MLDMGSGKALSSIFLARGFGVQVWATDLWIPAADNLGRVQEAGLEDLVFPVHAEAHALPFAAGFFDAAVSVDAYHYFGTDDLYLGYFARFVRPDVQIGMDHSICPCLDSKPAWRAKRTLPSGRESLGKPARSQAGYPGSLASRSAAISCMAS